MTQVEIGSLREKQEKIPTQPLIGLETYREK